MIRDLIALPPESKVWIYQADREISYDELDIVRPVLYHFSHTWLSHGTPVMSYANVFHKRFFVFVADESNLGVSGCSIDSSVHLIKQIEQQIDVKLFDRMLYTYMENEEILTVHHSQIKEVYDRGKVNNETLFFDNLVDTKDKFLKQWLKPLSESWHYNFVQ